MIATVRKWVPQQLSWPEKSAPKRISNRLCDRPINVCFVIDNLSRAGTESQLLALIQNISRDVVRPHLCLLDGTDATSQELLPQDCPALCLGLKKLIGARSVPQANQLLGFWRRHRIDVVQTYFLDSTYFAVPLAKLGGIRRVVRVQNNSGYWMTFWHRRMRRWVGRLADMTLTNSETGRQSLIDSERLASSRITVLDNGVDLNRFPVTPPPNMKGNPVRIGCVANLRPVKNLLGLIRVARKLIDRYPYLRFEIAGDGEQRWQLERAIFENRLVTDFRLVGSVSDIPAFLARQDIAVLPSHSEGMSNAVLEYMAAGRAIVVTDVGANRTLIRNGLEGLIVPPNSDQALASAIERYLTSPRLAQGCARDARRRVETEFDRKAMCRKFEGFYRTLMG
jgi:glycosyltransferase involved in cell wall biosynthesis